MILATIIVDPLDGDDVAGFAHYANHGLVTANVSAKLTLFGLRNILTADTKAQLGFCIDDGIRKTARLMVRDPKQVISQPLCGFWAYAGEFFQLGNKVGKRLGEKQSLETEARNRRESLRDFGNLIGAHFHGLLKAIAHSADQ